MGVELELELEVAREVAALLGCMAGVGQTGFEERENSGGGC